MITVKAPSTYKPEREYIVRVIMGEFLGLEYQISFGNHANTTLSCDSGDELILPDTLFQIPPEDWLTDKSLPQRPLYVFDAKSNKTDCRLVDQYVPIIYGTNPQKSDPANYLPIDIFGSAFFMLSRYEELVKRDMDDHSRFPAAASLAYQEGFIDRPIVNEYTELLWFALKSKWNGLKRRRRSFRILPSHDVDKPFEYAFLSTKELFKSCLTESARKRSAGFLKPVFNYLTHSKRLISDDPYNTFQWIMDINEKNGLQSTFYFFGQKTHLDIDGQYDIQDRVINKLIQQASMRGHAIGYHGSYHAFLNQKIMQKEFDRLKGICKKSGIEQKTWSYRQHYLRYHVQKTSSILEQIGIAYDSTLTFAEIAGFRCGCCYEYPLYDLINRRRLKLREQPLLVMDRSLISPKYMNLNYDDAYDFITKCKQRCELFDGDFVILWHNNLVVEKVQKELYQSILSS